MEEKILEEILIINKQILKVHASDDIHSNDRDELIGTLSSNRDALLQMVDITKDTDPDNITSIPIRELECAYAWVGYGRNIDSTIFDAYCQTNKLDIILVHKAVQIITDCNANGNRVFNKHRDAFINMHNKGDSKQ